MLDKRFAAGRAVARASGQPQTLIVGRPIFCLAPYHPYSPVVRETRNSANFAFMEI